MSTTRADHSVTYLDGGDLDWYCRIAARGMSVDLLSNTAPTLSSEIQYDAAQAVLELRVH